MGARNLAKMLNLRRKVPPRPPKAVAGTVRPDAPHGANVTCGIPFPRQLIGHGQAPCSAPDLFRAVQQAYRSGLDQPLHVPGCRVRWFSPPDACALLQTAGGLALGYDSLTRHMLNALFTVLIGDYVHATDVLCGTPRRPSGGGTSPAAPATRRTTTAASTC